MNRPAWPWLLASGLLMVALLAVGLRIGSYQTDYDLILKALLQYDSRDPAQVVLVELRLPRLLLALVAGAGLAVSGYLMQAMVNNPLADPYLLGTASGGALGAILVFAYVPALTVAGIYAPPLAALVGALGATLMVVVLGSRRGRILPTQLLLAGVAVGSLATALGGLLTYLAATEEKLRSISFWSMGGFEKASWTVLPYPAGALLLGMGVVSLRRNDLNLLLLGEERATALGLDVAQTRWFLLLTASLLTGCVVALCGPVGFVGLVVPHITRWVLGTVGRGNLLFCALLGGNFLLFCDLLARVLYPPAGLPVGLITALFGVPFFVYLLRKQGS
ncbi:hypothetical protein GCM10027346_27210 [Hymenobacter seoulensis]